MWLVTKQHHGAEPDREKIPTDILVPMVRWYIGQGNEADEKIGVALVQKAKTFERWFAAPRPPRQQHEQRQREEHAVRDQCDRIDAVSISQLDDDRLARESDGPCRSKQEPGPDGAGCWRSNGCRGSG